MEKEFWTFLKEKKATSISGVPYTFEVLKKLGFFNKNFSHLKTITQAGGKLDEKLNIELSEYCKKNRINYFSMYGQTEASPRMSYLSPKHSISKNGSIGKEIPGGKFHLRSEEGKKIVQHNKIGELVYNGPNVSLGYVTKRSDLSIGDENNGTLYTGDIAKRDEDGFYYIVGRKNRFVKLYGLRISLDNVEQTIKSISPNVACIGDDKNITIFVEKEDIINKLKSLLPKKFGISISAFRFKLLKEIPKNSYGKITYTDLV